MEEEASKFSLSTPSLGLRAYLRVLEGVPSSKRVVQDVDEVIHSLKAVAQEKGVHVEGLGVNRGKRHAPLSSERDSRGGRRERKQATDDYGAGIWLHPDAWVATDYKETESSKRFSGMENVKAVGRKHSESISTLSIR